MRYPAQRIDAARDVSRDRSPIRSYREYEMCAQVSREQRPHKGGLVEFVEQGIKFLVYLGSTTKHGERLSRSPLGRQQLPLYHALLDARLAKKPKDSRPFGCVSIIIVITVLAALAAGYGEKRATRVFDRENHFFNPWPWHASSESRPSVPYRRRPEEAKRKRKNSPRNC